MADCPNLATASDIQAVMGAINALAAKIPDNVATANHIAGLESQIAQLTARVTALESQLSNTENELSAIKSEQMSANGLLSNIPGWLEGLWGRIEGFFSWVGEGLSRIGSAIAEKTQWLWDKMQGIGEWIWDGLRGIGSAIAERAQWVWEKMQGVGEWIWDGLRWIFNKIGDVSDFLGGKIESVQNGLSNGFSGLDLSIKDRLSAFWDFITESFAKFDGWADGLFNRITDWTNTTFQGWLNSIGETISSLWNRINSVEDELFDRITNWTNNSFQGWLNSIYEWIRNIPSAIGDLLQGLIDALWQKQLSIFDFWGDLLHAIKNAIDWLMQNSGNGTGPDSRDVDFRGMADDVRFIRDNLNAPPDDVSDDLQYLRDNIDRLTGFVLGGLDSEDKVALNPEAEMRGLLGSVFSGDLLGSRAKEVVSLKEMLLAIAAVIYGRAGYQDYPISVPALPLGTEAAPLQIVTASRFNSWQTRFIDHGIGAFPFTINIEDSDLIKVGNQPIEAKFPNIAETLAEMSGLLITTKALSEANIEIALRALGESGSAKKQGFVTYRLLEAIVSYLGFKTKQRKENINLLYNPMVGVNTSKDSLTDALKPTTMEVVTERDDDKQSLAEILTLLIESARIIKAVNFRKVKDDGGAGLRDLFTADNPPETGEPDEFDKFIEEFEQGFIQRTNITDNLNPYGRNFERRPRVKELGDQTDLTP